MTPQQVVLECQAAGIALTLVGEQVACSGPKDALARLEPHIRANKQRIIDVLRSGDGGKSRPQPTMRCLPPSDVDTLIGLPILIADIECYFDKEFNLSKLSMPEYVMDGRFHVHGLAVIHPDGKSEFCTDVAALLRELQQRFGENLERVVVVMHNAAFDYSVLYHRYGLKLSHIVDTMLLSRLVNGPDQEASLRALAELYGNQPKGVLDFMAGVRNPDATQLTELRKYGTTDVELTDDLAARMLPAVLESVPEEVRAMEQSIFQYVERSFLVDLELVGLARQQVESELGAAVARTGHTLKEISGNKSFLRLLTIALAKTGRTPPMKEGARGPILALSKGDPQLGALLGDTDTQVRDLVRARVAITGSRDELAKLNHMQSVAKAMAGRCPFLLKYHAAQTGRYGGGDGLNPHNFADPDRAEGGATVAQLIRNSFQAQPGCALPTGDASQIEARILAFVAPQTDLHQNFAEGRDVYSEFASRQFKREVRKPRRDDPDELQREFTALRQIGKAAVLGLGYGMGVERFHAELLKKPQLKPLFDNGTLDVRTCARIVHGYRDDHPGIVQFWDSCEQAFQSAFGGPARRVGDIHFLPSDRDGVDILLPSGRQLVYRNIRRTPATFAPRTYIDRDGRVQHYVDDRPGLVYGRRKPAGIYGGKIAENIVQAIARDILVHAILALEDAGYPVVLHVHDSVTCHVPIAQVDACAKAIADAWRNVPRWIAGLALDSEVKSGPSLGELRKTATDTPAAVAVTVGGSVA